ncbi:MAG: hypothetical protein QOF51_3107, partial [Chloroflexota bacterium]|nr:hypothetical protein [Chloroflexota bacterium]
MGTVGPSCTGESGMTEFNKDPHVDHGGPGYPRPQLVRAEWLSLNGRWDFALDLKGTWRPADVPWDCAIEVPFAPETVRSGIGMHDPFRACWYRRTFVPPPLARGQRLLLHFGAVDYGATIWLQGVRVGQHEGGYTPFVLDVTEFVNGEIPHELVVRAEDDPTDLAKPRGKQDWQAEPHGIWYPRTTGIWQTVWLERVPTPRIARLSWTPSLERWEIDLDVAIDGEPDDTLRLDVTLEAGGVVLADDRYNVHSGEVHRRIGFSDPGIDDSRNTLLWSPERPTLIAAQLTLRDGRGQIVDTVESYTALRSIAVQGDRLVLNGRPYPLRMVLDQGYWADSGQTAPDDGALRHDVELAKAMGFNGVRKHQKIEDPRYLYWADHLGLLVWEEMPSAYRFTRTSIQRVLRDWNDALDRDSSHPCIITWVPFNESWGVPNLPDVEAERDYVQALYHLTRTVDPTRPVIGNDGWESVATDVIGIHDYDPSPERILRRYGADGEQPRLLARERPGGRMLLLGEQAGANRPIVLSEFGGISYAPNPRGTWGYTRAGSPAELADSYERLLDAVRRIDLFSGFCYTQFTDTYQEANGLLYMDRTPKIPIERIRTATQGPRG